MAVFPPFESVLLQVAKAVGASKDISSNAKNRFITNSMTLDKFHEAWEELLLNIFKALELDKETVKDLLKNIEDLYLAHKTIEKDVFTHKASPQKIVWHYLARVLLPALARHNAFWQSTHKMDAGMPGGKFWYLPFLDPRKSSSTIELPLQQVLKWLIDLIEEPKAGIAKQLESELRIHETSGSVLRSLNYWLAGEVTPEISSIKNTFPNDIELVFKGCFQPTNESCAFEQAIVFTKRKGYTAEILQHEVGISCDDLNAILNKKCDAEQKRDFVEKIAERFQQPSTKLIRQRLIIARAIQDGYEQLIKFLTGKNDKQFKFCTDPSKNKVLQLIRLYEITYNLTLAAQTETSISGLEQSDRSVLEAKENKIFTESLPDYLRRDVLVSVAYEDYDTLGSVGLLLSEIFSEAGSENDLDDIFPFHSPKHLEEMTKKRIGRATRNFNLSSEIVSHYDKLQQNKAPFKRLKNIDDFQIVHELGKFDYSNPKMLGLIIERLRALESTQEEELKRIQLELHTLLIRQQFDRKSEKHIEQLIQQGFDNPEHIYWKPYLLRFFAFHRMAQNNFKEASRLMREASEESKKSSFGRLRGELARDAFALAISNQKLIRNNHETFFRDMLLFDGLDSEIHDRTTPDIYDVSREMHEYFWKQRYKNYPAYTPLYSEAQREIQAFTSDFFRCAKDNLAIDSVLKKHSSLRKKQLKYPQSDSIILLVLKISYDMSRKAAQSINGLLDSDEQHEALQYLQRLLNNTRKAIVGWPEIADISDFKQQTPLMMAAHNQDYETTEILLKVGANPNLQDIKGRTAMHSACASRSIRCVKLFIEYNANERIKSIEGATPLHTAVRMGEIEIANLLADKFPHLMDAKEFGYRTPLMLANEIAESDVCYADLRNLLMNEERQVVSHAAYKELFSLLSSYTDAKSA